MKKYFQVIAEVGKDTEKDNIDCSRKTGEKGWFIGEEQYLKKNQE